VKVCRVQSGTRLEFTAGVAAQAPQPLQEYGDVTDRITLEHARSLARDFAPALSEIDAIVGVRWRPPYADLAGAPPEREPDGGDALKRAHSVYAEALEFFASHPALLDSQPATQRARLEAALNDARERFGRESVSLDYLLEVIAGEKTPELAITTPQAPLPSPAAGGDTEPAHRSNPVDAPASGPMSAATVEASLPRQGRRLALISGVGALALIVALIVLAVRLLGPGGTANEAPPRVLPATLPAAVTAAGPPPDVTALVRACPAIPSGQLPPEQTVVSTALGVGNDPVTNLATPQVTVNLGRLSTPGSRAFSVTVVVLPFSATPASLPGGAASDHAGTAQLIAQWDGSAWHRGLRTWTGSAWSTAVDLAASDLDLTTNGASLTFWWQGLTTGAHIGEITASATGCGAHDLDAALTPQQEFSG